MITRYFNGNMYDVFRPRGKRRGMAIVWTWQGIDSGGGFKRVAYRKPRRDPGPISAWAMDYWERLGAEGVAHPSDRTDLGPEGS